jgi:subtilisin-like proprotein convertase family protein
MKTRFLSLCSVLLLAPSLHAGVDFTGGSFANGGLIPDGSAVGSSATVSVSGLQNYITDISVTLNISGGYNGDLYAYLSYGGVLVPLLNRVGVGTGDAFGYSTAGMTITLAGNPGDHTDIHWVSSPSSSTTYAPDGRVIDPQGAPSTFDAAGTIGLSSFSGLNPNGTWTLFFADLSAGEQSTVSGWSLNIGSSAVPEPANVALGIFGGLFALVGLVRSRRVRNRLHGWRVAANDWLNAV